MGGLRASRHEVALASLFPAALGRWKKPCVVAPRGRRRPCDLMPAATVPALRSWSRPPPPAPTAIKGGDVLPPKRLPRPGGDRLSRGRSRVDKGKMARPSNAALGPGVSSRKVVSDGRVMQCRRYAGSTGGRFTYSYFLADLPAGGRSLDELATAVRGRQAWSLAGPVGDRKLMLNVAAA